MPDELKLRVSLKIIDQYSSKLSRSQKTKEMQLLHTMWGPGLDSGTEKGL